MGKVSLRILLFVLSCMFACGCKTIIDAIKVINGKLPEYKRIDFVELKSEEYEKTSTRKIKRGNLPEVCSKDGIRIF